MLFKDIMTDPKFLDAIGVKYVRFQGTLGMTDTSKGKPKLVDDSGTPTTISPTKPYLAEFRMGAGGGGGAHFLGLKPRTPDDEGKRRGFYLYDPSRTQTYESSSAARGRYEGASGQHGWERNPAISALVPGGLFFDPRQQELPQQPSGFVPTAGGGFVKATKAEANDTFCQTCSISYLRYGLKYANWGSTTTEWVSKKREMILNYLDDNTYFDVFLSEAYSYASNAFYKARGLDERDIRPEEFRDVIRNYIATDSNLTTL